MKTKVIDGLFPEMLNVSKLAAAVGASPSTLWKYKNEEGALKNAKACVVARKAKHRHLSMEEKARLLDELAE